MSTKIVRKVLIFPCVAVLALLSVQIAHESTWAGTDFDTASPSPSATLTDQQQRLLASAERIETAPLAAYQGTGKRLNIAICGVDSRIGETYVHADANHVLSISLDSGTVEIISVPRDTYVPLGFDSSRGRNLNILSNARIRKGMGGYLRVLSDVAKVGEIPYYVEVGFSQALGIIEFLGYNQPQHTLRVLRSRKAYAGGDFQRVHSQGQFMAQAIKRNFRRFDGVLGDMLISSGLLFVNSNLTAAEAKGIVHALRERGFLSSSAKGITTRLMPAIKIRFQDIDFANETALDSIHTRIDELARASRKDTLHNQAGRAHYTDAVIWSLLVAARTDSAHPRDVIRRLQRPFEQRAWLQVADSTQRSEQRRWFGLLLSDAYRAINRPEKAEGIQKLIRREIELFLLCEEHPAFAEQPEQHADS
jgi:hypothetical protein